MDELSAADQRFEKIYEMISRTMVIAALIGGPSIGSTDDVSGGGSVRYTSRSRIAALFRRSSAEAAQIIFAQRMVSAHSCTSVSNGDSRKCSHSFRVVAHGSGGQSPAFIA